ncbi:MULTISPECIES: polysaccharide deacetylase family protein [unclassified Kitasatospora]|uniref:polysaccharide deacetylase family protein n=1 Tax=unclassified Kitasatospora TaxID=2633591 RepID=UPI000DB9B170|nr:polysaccharide deacetylase family protein [Kitasatospora sp. SolWspMP-SS2h]RAJ33130.1 peptidoglycan/xylan/chitin deacetylase (PgdA/CDA1 family) [Kitasatospora sp. SolWspMP-SS2h]
MTVDRRSVLRSASRLAALSAAGGLVAACGGPSDVHGPDGPSVAARPQPAHLTESPAAGPSGSPSPSPSPSPSATPFALPPLAADTPQEVVTGPRTRPQLALTFHGQGDPAIATALLTTAEQRGARLTVLAVGSWLDEQPRIAERILSGGHELGNHTQNHLDICALSAEQAHEEIAQCAQRLERLTGSIGRWFRPSAAQYANAMVKEQAQRVGYPHVLSFDVDPRDYADPGAETVTRRVLRAAAAGSVVALHMDHPGTVTALPAILDGLAGQGLHAVTASELCA